MPNDRTMNEANRRYDLKRSIGIGTPDPILDATVQEDHVRGCKAMRLRMAPSALDVAWSDRPTKGKLNRTGRDDECLARLPPLIAQHHGR
jgi:hypothetical protein